MREIGVRNSETDGALTPLIRDSDSTAQRVLHQRAEGVQTQYASHGDATCAADSKQNTTRPAMAVQFARARYIARSSGGSAVRSAAYNARDAITAERTGELYYFKHRDAPDHHEVLLPDGTAEQFLNASVLWNAAEAAEKRKDAQVAREIVLALPADKGINDEDRIELARSFATQHFVAKGLAVQLDVHAPHEGAEESERANWHAHLLITTRRIEGENFAAKKARDLDPEVRRAGARAIVADGEAWGALWRGHQNQYFQEHGLDLRVDPTATHAGQHIGPVRMRKVESGIAERAELLRQANEAAARDPDQVLATLTRNNATFTERDLDRHLAKHLPAAAERSAMKAKVFEHQELVSLHDRATGEEAGRFTTRTVRAQDWTATDCGRQRGPISSIQGLPNGRRPLRTWPGSWTRPTPPRRIARRSSAKRQPRSASPSRTTRACCKPASIRATSVGATWAFCARSPTRLARAETSTSASTRAPSRWR